MEQSSDQTSRAKILGLRHKARELRREFGLDGIVIPSGNYTSFWDSGTKTNASKPLRKYQTSNGIFTVHADGYISATELTGPLSAYPSNDYSTDHELFLEHLQNDCGVKTIISVENF